MPTPDGWVTLIMPDGMRGETWTYQPSHGTVSYTAYREDAYDPNSRWLLDVPADQAWYFMNKGGYGLARTPLIPDSSAIVYMYHPDGHSCGWGGVSFQPDEKGVVGVPAEAVADLQSHGFLPAPPDMLEDPKDDDDEEPAAECRVPRRRAPAGA